MLLIYVPRITSRVSYTFNHVFSKLLQTSYELTTDPERLIKYEGAKMSYNKSPIGSEFFINNHSLLFSTGIENPEINMSRWDDLPIFFECGKHSDLVFDLFAAVFFLLSRYEECYPSVKDNIGRYKHQNSIAFKNDFIDYPLVDMWCARFKELLSKQFPYLSYKERIYQQTSVIDIMEFFAFRKKGLLRNIGGTLIDIYQMNFKRVVERYAVLFGFRKDPYDIFDELIDIHSKNEIKCMFFAHVGDFSLYDKSIHYLKRSYRSALMSLADYHKINLLVSYEAFGDADTIKCERERLEDVLKRNIDWVRFHFNRLQLPDTYRKLSDIEFVRDYSMGYSKRSGFRASTCTPFRYYDPVNDILLPIEVYPFCVYKLHLPVAGQESISIEQYKTMIREFKGHFISVLSNSFLSKQGASWQESYAKFLR